MKILVIEDQPAELKLAHDVLEAAGHDVRRADTAERALASINADRPEAILVDLHLPGMDGLGLVRKLKANPGTRGIPVIAITSHQEKFTKADALRSGCAAYLVKPISPRLLPGQIAAVVSRKI
jgi:CheY-like chemotaxis protein